MIKGENDNILNKTILENPRLAEKLVLTNLNEFEKILKLFDEDVILILLNTGEHWFEKELKKRTYYNQNFIAPRLVNTSESIPSFLGVTISTLGPRSIFRFWTSLSTSKT